LRRETRVLGFPLGVRRDAATTAEVGSNTLKGDEIACLPHYSVGEVRGAPSKRPAGHLGLARRLGDLAYLVVQLGRHSAQITGRRPYSCTCQGHHLGVTVLPSTTAANVIGIL
jgi:hypothetical protein